MKKASLKDKVCKVIEQNAQRIIDIGTQVWKNPELGYKEYKTAALVEKTWEELGLPFESQLARTGSKALLKGEESKTTVALMGELDAVICPEHPCADTETGAAHSCAHHAQIAALLGAAIGLVRSGVSEHLSGDIAFMAVPAEEPVEMEFRQRLREKGEIGFLGGKQEMIRIGALDDVDMTVMFHSTNNKRNVKAMVGGTSNGFIAKLIKYKGREAHAGSPSGGINALNAAMMGLQGIHAQRETFKDSDCIRIHPIITKGGDLVNIIPADVRLETFVRGKSMKAVMSAARKTNRALKAGAMAVGAEVEIIEIPGFYPRNKNDEILNSIFRSNISALIGEENVDEKGHGAGSSDIGDVMQIMPAVHPYIGGMKGSGHTKERRVVDEYLAYIVSAKSMAMTLIDLLAEGAEKGLQVKAQQGYMSKTEYLDYWSEITEQAGREE